LHTGAGPNCLASVKFFAPPYLYSSETVSKQYLFHLCMQKVVGP